MMMMTVLVRMAVAMMMSDHLWCSIMLDAFVSDFAQMLIHLLLRSLDA